ncbi:sperm-associated antigen 4 protein-like [Calonectris borealis]|uniref:sperm-associated antigen 4 protein-like n=1 Tax=Calonectris borealis TaxID=1323832 RepID=UPI003F4C38DF
MATQGNSGHCLVLQDTGNAGCKSGKQSKMPTSEENARGGNTEKIQRGSQERPGEPEELANGPMNRNLDFKERHHDLEKEKALYDSLLDEPRCFRWCLLRDLDADVDAVDKGQATGAAIDLQRLSSSSAWLCRVFWVLCAPQLLDTFVQPDASPGYCWPFQGSQSEVLIRLPTQVQPMSITVQHTSKIAFPLGTVSRAPRDFTISGLDEEGKDETLLGTFTYAMQKEPTQTFPLQNKIPRAFRFLKIIIQSNWGKTEYTCIYRVQVYGKIMGTNAISQTHVETFHR